MKTVLTIAGSDCSGGAGIQADLKTMTSLGVYGMSAVTALTAQNTTGVYGILDSTPEFLANQLDCIFTDIRPDADKLEQYQAKQIVIDPVMVSTSKSRLLEEDALYTLMEFLLPLADLITPNIPEAELLAGSRIETERDMTQAAERIADRFHTAVLVKGGHQLNREGQAVWFYGKRIDNSNTHGTGCTLSSAIACGLAKGYSMEESVKRAKQYLSNALSTDLNLGKGSGPLNHCFSIENTL